MKEFKPNSNKSKFGFFMSEAGVFSAKGSTALDINNSTPSNDEPIRACPEAAVSLGGVFLFNRMNRYYCLSFLSAITEFGNKTPNLTKGLL